jgi:ribosomal protein S16
MKTILIIAALVCIQTFAKAAPDFITTVGEYQPYAGTSIQVFIKNDKVQYSIKSGSTLAGPVEPVIDSLTDWFLYPETNRRFWVYSGGGRLLLMEFDNAETKLTGSGTVKDLLDRAPQEVRDRISTTMNFKQL